jgi:ATP-dependent helicase/nuclease subunit A
MTPPDQPARDEALRLDRHIVAIAPAGSGKTGLLVQRFLAALATCERPEQVVAITFTTKAAAEIRDRVLAALTEPAESTPDDAHTRQQQALAQAVRKRDAELGWRLAATPSRLRAQTIDGLNAAIAAELPLFSGLGGRLRVSDDARGLIESAVDAVFAAALGSDADPELFSAVGDLLASVNNRLDTLTPALVALMERRDQWSRDLMGPAPDDDAPLALLVDLQIAAQQRLTRVLGADVERLVAAARTVAVSDDHFAWARDLAEWPTIDANQEALYRQLAALLLTKQGTLRSPKGIRADMGFKAGTPAHTLLKALITDRDGDAQLEAAAADLLTLPPPRLNPALAHFRQQLRVVLRHLLAHHRVVMSGRGETDFVEVALAAGEALRPDGAFGEALLKRDAQIRHLLVDEMQDTSASQVALLEQLTEGWQPGDGRSLFMVGDPQQSIYAFRKADVRVFTQLIDQRQLGNLRLDVVQLHANFRSDPAVVEWVNQTLAPCFSDQPDLDRGEVPFTHGLAQKPSRGGSVTVQGFTSAAAEARCAAELIQTALARSDQHSVAVLARARKHLVPLIDELRRRQLPFSGIEIDPLASRPAVRDLLACVRACWHAADHLSWLIWLRAPSVGLSWADLLRMSRGRKDWPWRSRLAEADLISLTPEGGRRVSRLNRALQAIDNDPRLRADLPAAVRSLWRQLGGDAGLSAQDHIDVERCFELIELHAAGGSLDLPALQRAIERLYAEPGQQRLQLMTLHKAKGLEFDEVLLVGCGNSPRGDQKPLLSRLELPQQTPILVPKPPVAQDAQDDWSRLFEYSAGRERAVTQAEGLRLLYVATTRAKQHLHLLATGTAINEGDKDADLRFGANTFASRLNIPFPLVDIETVPDAVAFDRQRAPLAPRLPLSADVMLAADVDTPGGLPIPVEQRSVRPSERVLAPDDEALAADGERLAQWRGRLFHQAMEAISLEGDDAWKAHPARRQASMQAALHRAGLPPEDVAVISDQVMQAVDQALASDIGRGILGRWPWAKSEYPLAGFVDGQWTSAVIDRCFEAADGTLWIVDYKLAAPGDQARDPDVVIKAAAAHYQPQIDRYAQLMAALRPGKPIQTALYLVALDALVDRVGERLVLPPPP